LCSSHRDISLFNFFGLARTLQCTFDFAVALLMCYDAQTPLIQYGIYEL